MAESVITSKGSYPEIRDVSFEEFWSRSRYRTCVKGMDAGNLVKKNFKDIETEGGFVHFLKCHQNGRFAGSMVVYKDTWYRSYRRDDVACFGLVTVAHAGILKTLLERARRITENHGFSVIRGPVNSPRFLYGYGVQAGGYEWPVVGGSSTDPPRYLKMFATLENEHLFNQKDKYYNVLQDFEKTKAYMATLDFDRNYSITNPDLDDFATVALKIANMMNRTLGYRPDYLEANEKRLNLAAKMYKLVPGAEKLVGLLCDGDIIAGALIIQPDWFQVFSGVPVTRLIGDITMLDEAYQGRRLFLNLSEYSMNVLREFGSKHLEHASIWENQESVKASVKNGFAKFIKEFWIFELHP